MSTYPSRSSEDLGIETNGRLPLVFDISSTSIGSRRLPQSGGIERSGDAIATVLRSGETHHLFSKLEEGMVEPVEYASPNPPLYIYLLILSHRTAKALHSERPPTQYAWDQEGYRSVPHHLTRISSAWTCFPVPSVCSAQLSLPLRLHLAC